MPHSKYISHGQYINRHVDLTFWHKYAKIQPTETSSSCYYQNTWKKQICPWTWAYMPILKCIYGEYMHIYATYEVTDINHATGSIVPIFYIYISLNKYGCHILNIAPTVNMLDGHIDPNLCISYTNTINCSFHFTYFCQVCARNKGFTVLGI